jgi:5-methylcytosine-specific restriction endonuclease McrA
LEDCLDSKEKTKYRRSKKWKSFRESIIKETKHSCELCGMVKRGKQTRYLQLHHLDPSTYGNEEREDVVLLCASCHETVERLLKRKQFSIDEFLISFKAIFTKSKEGLQRSKKL